jgi:trehalose 6-phosphate synthase
MQLYDVLLVNPLIDGMNLVAKEGATVNQNNGVMVLSEGAGAAEQLGEGALVVSPADVIGTAEALHKALEMSLEERQRRAEWLRRSVAAEDITMWLYHQLADIRQIVGTPVVSSPGEGVATTAARQDAAVDGADADAQAQAVGTDAAA